MKNEHLVAKIVFDIAANRPFKVWATNARPLSPRGSTKHPCVQQHGDDRKARRADDRTAVRGDRGDLALDVEALERLDRVLEMREGNPRVHDRQDGTGALGDDRHRVNQRT